MLMPLDRQRSPMFPGWEGEKNRQFDMLQSKYKTNKKKKTQPLISTATLVQTIGITVHIFTSHRATAELSYEQCAEIMAALIH